MPSKLTPRGRDVNSRSWAFYVNTLAASPLISRPTRVAMLRRSGIEVETAHVFPGCYFHHADLKIGRDAWINHGVHIENVARVEIGPKAGLGAQTVVLTSTHDIGPHEMRIGEWHYLPVTVGAGAWVGARSLILPGVTIGEGCVIAAGSVVREDCDADALYAGVPARRVRDLPPAGG